MADPDWSGLCEKPSRGTEVNDLGASLPMFRLPLDAFRRRSLRPGHDGDSRRQRGSAELDRLDVHQVNTVLSASTMSGRSF